MAENHFLLKPDEYTRSIQPIKDWLHQTAWYASKQLNQPLDKCIAHLRKKMNSGEISFNDPLVVFFHREENGDKHRKTVPLRSYIQKALQDSNIIVPTFTTYLPPEVLESPIVGYLDDNVVVRKVYKKKAQELEALGDKTGYLFYNGRQDNAKRANNSVSGGFVAEGSIIQNKTGHSTLTSITRSIASLSNASNERLIEGNRHYYSPQITLNNIISVCSNSDLELIDDVIAEFGLVYPTEKQTSDAIFRSYQLYCKDTLAFREIENFIKRLTPTERAAIVYTGDLYHIKKFNEDFMRVFLSRLSFVETTPVQDAVADQLKLGEIRKDPVGYIYSVDEQIVNFAHQTNISIMKGKGKKYKEKLTYEEQLQLALTCYNIEETVLYYKDFLKAFFLTKNSPCTIATIQQQIRRSVVLSDTDSTMFSVDSWVEWYFGSIGFTDKHFAVAGAVMYMATQAIAHILALFSANMGVEKKRLFTLAMKPEFGFPVFAQTSVAKHYYTARLIKEGNVYNDIEMEIKGVHMIDSTVPINIIKSAAEIMEEKIRAIMDGKQLSLHEVLTQSADIEREIISSIRRGETKYLRKTKIKERSAYKQDDNGVDKTPYRFYACWEQCFAEKYGNYGAPPYQAVRIPLNLPNPSSVKIWLDSLPDQKFANNFRNWMTQAGMNKIQLFPIPMAFTESHGIPDEFIPIVDDKRIALSLTRSFRNIIESHGFFPKNDLLISEMGY